ncbi:NlpC/P60 family protein [Clostridium grantii]|uniref:Cell wall-associated hydrolase, NlpC family n=1 Tax=Clostridium grantii DSM 8605 TaxID=1121316 RepID=A0A1M5QIY9_9CLOT|nr:C40 family peptidase [Clostridium grantii]SHH14087.1 Cell wall-associated hydrolase, NlpC family [Clostridium grantii DSM 8605]
MKKRIFTIILTISILFSTNSYIDVVADTLQKQLEQQNKDLKETQSNLSDAQSLVNKINSKIEMLDYQIETTMYEIEDLNTKITETEKNIKNAEDKIVETENEIDEEIKLYNDRMVAMYISGNSGYLGVLLGAENLNDLYSKVQTIITLTNLDKEIISSLTEKIKEIEEAKILLQNEKEQLAADKIEVNNKMSKLTADQEEQKGYIVEARAQVSLYESEFSENKDKINETMDLIELAKAKAKEEEEKKKAEETARIEAEKKAAEAKALAEAQKSTSEKTSTNTSSGSTNEVEKETVAASTTPSISSNAIVAYASNFLGRDYVWGATGPNYFDCSGLTQYVYKHFGINIPRVSRDQARAGTYVAKTDLQAGDLVFFAYSNGVVHHVGIYIGNDSFIHAPQTGDVVKISLLSSRSDYYTARRYK